VTQSYDNDFGGLAQATDAEVPVSEEDFVGNTIVVKRLAGPIGEKNRYAQVLVVLIPLAITRMLAERRKSLRFAAFVAMMLILGGIQFTFSRGAGVAIGVILLALLPMRLAKARHFMIVGTLIVIAVFALAPGYFYRLSTLGDVADLVSGDPTEAGSSVQGRATENLATLLMFLDHPVVGVGPGQAPRLMRDYGRGIGFRLLDPNRRAHNMHCVGHGVHAGHHPPPGARRRPGHVLPGFRLPVEPHRLSHNSDLSAPGICALLLVFARHCRCCSSHLKAGHIQGTRITTI